jgi:hypothetical protein
VAWEFDSPNGSYTGRLLVDGEIYTPAEATVAENSGIYGSDDDLLLVLCSAATSLAVFRLINVLCNHSAEMLGSGGQPVKRT